MEREEIRFNDSLIEFHKTLQEWMSNDNEQTDITVLGRTEAVYGFDGCCDVEYCKEHGIPYSKPPTFKNAGCIIGVKGNVLLNVSRKLNGGECLSDSFSKAVRDYLSSRGLSSARCDNNDILVDGFKVASAAEITMPNGLQYLGFQISIYQDIETIKKVCLKPMVKVPIALDKYGITTQEIVDFCVKYWTEH